MAEEKTATNVDEQIIKLKSRGMMIADESKAKENLLDIGYYRLGFYWFPFEKSYPRKDHRTHEFKEGTKFDYAIKLYYFDFDLRNILLRYISRIEINFRTQLIYIVSNKYKENPFWYLDPKILKPNFIGCNSYKNAINEANKISTIKMDLICHNRNDSPAWKLIENLTFGVVISIYDNLIDGGLKHDISVAYGIQSPSQFSNYINTVRRLRNYCAHEKVLFDMTLPVAISNGPIGYLGTRKTMLFGAYKVFKYLLGRVSDNRVANMKAKLLNAFARVQYPEIKNIIFDNSGFRIEEI